MKPCIRFAPGYKYQLRHTYSLATGIIPERPIKTAWIELDERGQMTIFAGYAWDGASGPTYDSASSMRPSLVHDAFYQLLRLGLLAQSLRKAVDELFHRMCLEDGMWAPRAWLWLRAVRNFGEPGADPANVEPDECAPCDCEKAP